eukprot:g5193.t1
MRLFAAGNEVSINESTGTAVKRVSSWGDGLILLQPAIRIGSARWRFRINRGRKVTFGVCASDVRLETFVNETDRGWGYYQANGCIGHAGPAKTEYGCPLKPGDVIEVEADANIGVISFHVNGKDFGPAFRIGSELRELGRDLGLVGAVSLYEKGSSVTLLECLHCASYLRSSRLVQAETGPRPLVVTKTKKGWNGGLALVGCGVNSGRWTWTFQIDRGSNATVGVCAEGVALDGYVNQTNKGWGYYQANGNLGHGGPAAIEYGEAYRISNVVIDVELDCDEHTLRFYKDGVDQGVAFDNLPAGTTFFGAISLYNSTDRAVVVKEHRGGITSTNISGKTGVISEVFASDRRTSPIATKQRTRTFSSSFTLKNSDFKRAKVGSDLDIQQHKTRTGVIRITKKKKGWSQGLFLAPPPLQLDTTRLKNGIVRWSFRIERGLRASIGICTQDAPLEGYVNQTIKGFGYYQGNGRIGNGGAAQTLYGKSYEKRGTIVDVDIDYTERTLRFYLDGVDQGIAFQDLPDGEDEFFGAVSLYEKNASIDYLGCHYWSGDMNTLVDKWGESGAQVKMSPSKDTIEKDGTGWDGGMALTGRGVYHGHARWRFRIDVGKKATFGICIKGVPIDGYVNETRKGWGLYQNGCLGHGSPASLAYGEKFSAGSEVEVDLDLERGELRFIVNGIDYGVAFDNIPIGPCYCGAISLFKKGDRATFLGVKMNVSCIHGSMRNNSENDHLFKESKSGSFLKISEEGQKITKLQKGWPGGMALIGSGVSSGRAKWSFRILRGSKSTVGVCVKGVQQEGYVNQSEKGWGYYQANGMIGHGGPATTAYGEPYLTDYTIIDIELDCDKSILRFYKNGIDQGVAFDNLPKGSTFFGAISLYDKNDSAEIISKRDNAEYKNKLDLGEIGSMHLLLTRIQQYCGSSDLPTKVASVDDAYRCNILTSKEVCLLRMKVSIVQLEREFAPLEVEFGDMTRKGIENENDDNNENKNMSTEQEVLPKIGEIKINGEDDNVNQEGIGNFETGDSSLYEEVSPPNVPLQEKSVTSTTTSIQSTALPPTTPVQAKSASEIAVWKWLVTIGIPSEKVEFLFCEMINDGFDTMAAVKTLTEEDLCEMKIKKGHRRLILDAINAKPEKIKTTPKKPSKSLRFKQDLPEGDVPLYVKKLDGRTLSISVHSEDTVHCVKRRILKVTGIPIEKQLLIFAGTKMLDEKLIKDDYSIQRESTLQLLVMGG